MKLKNLVEIKKKRELQKQRVASARAIVTDPSLVLAASQGLATFTLKLFEASMNEYRFAVSTSAIGKTILYFGIMFLLVMIFNVFIISKYKIIDLLTAGRKNENISLQKKHLLILV